MHNIQLRRVPLHRACMAGLLLAVICGTCSTISAAPPDEAERTAAENEALDGKILLAKFKQTGEVRSNRRQSNSGISSAEAKRAAFAALPLKKLAPAVRQKILDVVDSAGMFRRLPTIIFASDPDAYEYFVYHPDVAVSIWRAMQISKLQLWQTGRFEYEGDADDGTIGTMDVLFQSPNLNLVYCEGEFKNPLLPKPIRAKSVILLRTAYSQENDGKTYITHTADLYVAFPSQTVESLAKILTPLSGRIADRTFSDISLFMKMMGMAMEKRPGWVEQIIGKMDGIPEMRRKQLLRLTARIYAAAIKRKEAGTQSTSTTARGQTPRRSKSAAVRQTRRRTANSDQSTLRPKRLR